MPLEAEDGGLRVTLGVAIGTVLTLLGLALVQAATARAVAEIDAGRPVSTRRAYRLAAPSAGPLLGALAVAVAVVTALAAVVFLIPVAVWLTLRWALLVPVVELEDATWRRALRRSAVLVRRQWFKVATLVVVAAVLAIAAGPILGALLLFIPAAPLGADQRRRRHRLRGRDAVRRPDDRVRVLRHARPRAARALDAGDGRATGRDLARLNPGRFILAR